jgi:hypothetical protein
VHPDRFEPRVSAAAGAGRPRDVVTLLGELSDAIAIVTVAQRSLETRECAQVGDETVALRYALSLLRAAYSGLDLASERARRAPRSAR